MFKDKTYWIIGASEGLGRAIAKELDQQGANLIISARTKERLVDLADELSAPVEVYPLDVMDVNSIEAAIAQIGSIDGIVFIAGLYEPMGAQNWNVEVSERICDVNFLGAVRVLGRITPEFTKRDRGHIVIIGSLSGYRGLPSALAYGASKAGLMHLAEAMQADLWRTNIKVQLFNPGFIRTRLTDKNNFHMPFLMSPEAAARPIVRKMHGNRFKHDIPWNFSLIFRLSRMLPQAIYQRIFS